MKSFFSSITQLLTKSAVTQISFSPQECVKALSKYESKSASTLDIKTIIPSIKDGGKLTLETAQKLYSLEQVALDVKRDAPRVTFFKNKQEIQSLESNEFDFDELLKILKKHGDDNHQKRVDFFSHLASQNVMSTSVNLVNGLCLATNDQWSLQTSKSKAAVTLSVYEKAMIYTKRVPIESIRAPDEEGDITSVIQNQNNDPIAFATTSVTIRSDAKGQPRHRINYGLESNNEQFRQAILKPLDKQIQAVRKEQLAAQAELQDNKNNAFWHPSK